MSFWIPQSIQTAGAPDTRRIRRDTQERKRRGMSCRAARGGRSSVRRRLCGEDAASAQHGHAARLYPRRAVRRRFGYRIHAPDTGPACRCTDTHLPVSGGRAVCQPVQSTSPFLLCAFGVKLFLLSKTMRKKERGFCKKTVRIVLENAGRYKISHYRADCFRIWRRRSVMESTAPSTCVAATKKNPTISPGRFVSPAALLPNRPTTCGPSVMPMP